MADIPKANKIAIILPKDIDNKRILAVSALYNHLATNETTVEVVTEEGNTKALLLKKFSPNVLIKNALPPKRFVLSIKKDDNDIENVQWQQDEKNVNIFISATRGNITPANVKFSTIGADYDLAILPDVDNLESLGKIATENEEFFKSTKLLGIGGELNLGDEYKYDSITKSNLTTLGENVFTAIESQGPKKEVSQLLFTSILLETDYLKLPVKSSEIFAILKKLVDRGAKTEESKAISDKLIHE